MQAILPDIQTAIDEAGYTVVETNLGKPWGGYVRLDDADAEAFVRQFFPDLKLETYENLSPKFLMVAPGQRLSWQEHERRAERWCVTQGPVGVKINDTPEEPEEVQRLEKGETVEFDAGTCHRLVGLGDWGVVAETWIHTDPRRQSDEEDITRHADDYKR